MDVFPTRVTRPLLQVLAALNAADEVHGWAIAKDTGRGGPTVYKLLDRLAAEGWVSARWEPVDDDGPARPRRRYYRLTERGRERSAVLLAEVGAGGRRG